MKTAVSIPDNLFEWADSYAKEHGLSRSEVYARAIETLKGQEITRKLNEVYAEEDNRDPVLQKHASRMLAKEDW